MGGKYSGGDAEGVRCGGEQVQDAGRDVEASVQGVVTAFARAYADVGDARVDEAMETFLTTSRRFLLDVAQTLEAAGTVAVAAAGDLTAATGGTRT